ncbi:MAG: signal peptidase I [Oryzihumus sp.]
MPTPTSDTRSVRRRGRLRQWAVNLTLAAAALGVVAAAAAVLSGSYQARPVLSGSMTPGLPVGGVVLAQRVPAAQLQVRDVIVFAKPGSPGDLVVHRIIKLSSASGQVQAHTQGDANNTPDPWTVSLRGDTAYRVVGSLPLLGYASVWLHGTTSRQVLLFGGGLVCLLACTRLLRRAGGRPGPVPVHPLMDSGEPCST